MRTNHELVSVIIPTYNRAIYVERAIKSVLSQSYKNFEIIVVDDGSDDDTKERLKKFKPKIKYLYQDNAGVSTARNRGIKEAKGVWIAFLDSDDEWLNDKLKKQMDCLNKNKISICFTGADFQKNYNPKNSSNDTDYLIYDDAFDLILNQNLTAWIQTLIIKKTLLSINSFNEKLRVAEDTELIFSLASIEPFAYIPDVQVLLNDDPIDRLTTNNYNTLKIRNKAALNILFNAYLSYNKNAKNIKILRRRIGFFLSEKAIIGCIEGKKFSSKYNAIESLLFGVDIKIKIRNILVFCFNKTMRMIYKKKWKCE